MDNRLLINGERIESLKFLLNELLDAIDSNGNYLTYAERYEKAFYWFDRLDECTGK